MANSFPYQNALIVAASGGIGSALCDALLLTTTIKQLYATSRTARSYDDERIIPLVMDITDEQTIAAAMASIATPLDLIIIASGTLHNECGTPEKKLGDFNANYAAHNYAVNTLGPMLVAKHASHLLPRDRPSCFAAISARVGSISDNHLGGWYSYRAAKAALNMMLKTLSIELARKYPQTVVLGLHPGTVNTALSQPFQPSGTSGKILFSPAQSAAYLLDVIAKKTPADSGGCFAYDGSPIVP